MPEKKSFFLLGARGVGKSTWIDQELKYEIKINLLENRSYLELLRDPGMLDARLSHLKPGTWVVIDEVQRLPQLLTEVHRLIEDKRLFFALTGSSARRLKNGGADLLAGRAIRRLMEPFTYGELKNKFELDKVLQWGTLPLVYLDPENAIDTLEAYVQTYLREEIKEEGLVRKLESFVRFLDVASVLQGQQINGEAIAREARIPRSSIDGYFSILEDTLVGFRLPGYQPKAKLREVMHPKFYWFDPGVARGCANRLTQSLDGSWLGIAFETFIFHELRIYNHLFQKFRPLSYYRVPSGLEVDFVIELEPGTRLQRPSVILIEVKLSKKWDRSWNKSMLSLKNTQKVQVVHLLGVYSGSERLTFGDIQVLPVGEFLNDLYEGLIF